MAAELLTARGGDDRDFDAEFGRIVAAAALHETGPGDIQIRRDLGHTAMPDTGYFALNRFPLTKLWIQE